MQPRPAPKTARWSWLPPLMVALPACAAVWLCVRPGGPPSGAPGITLDEPFNVREGVRLAYGIPEWIAGRMTLDDLWGDAGAQRGRKSPLGSHLADHPPLGRVWIGAWHNAVASGGDDGPAVSIAAGRASSAVAFGVTVFLVGFFAARWYGTAAGLFASLALATMPRVFGHAHLAALETFTNLTFAASVLTVAHFWKEKPPGWKRAALTGVLFGLALLSKIQAVFIPAPVAVWALWRYRGRAVLPLAVWGVVGFAVFFAGWPWLWLDPAGHLQQFFASATERATLHVFYWGEKFADRDAPWHYPFVMFLATVPVGWQLAGFAGVGRRTDDPGNRWRNRLLCGAVLTPLIAFALPGVVVYDGVRLFLVVFPLWAVLIGRGAAAVFDALRRRWSFRAASLALAAIIAVQALPLVMIRPCYLSYYNSAIGGVWGAEKLGFELNYWGDAVMPAFLGEVAAAVPEGTTVDVVPVLHTLQLPTWQQESTALRERGIRLRAYDPPHNGPATYVLIFRRRAGLPPELEPPPDNAKLLAVVQRQGIVLAALYAL